MLNNVTLWSRVNASHSFQTDVRHQTVALFFWDPGGPVGVVLMTLLPVMCEFNIICFNKCQIRKQISALTEHEKFDFRKKLFLYRSEKGLVACNTKHGVHTKRSVILAIFFCNFIRGSTFTFSSACCAVKGFPCNVFCFSLFAGQIKRSMYAFSPVECLDCTSNLTAAGLGWLVKVLWFACDAAVCVHVDLLNFVPLGFVGN